MFRRFVVGGVLALAVIVSTAVQADDKDKKDEVPPIKEIMKKAHAKGGLRFEVAKAVKDKDWETAAKDVKEWEKLGEALAKNKPPKGDAEDWKKRTTTYNKTMTTLSEAVTAKDAKKANGALGKINSMCGGCHKEHRGK
jgi:cytochrome c556